MKNVGHIAELRFQVKASEMGYTVLIPNGDSEPYDVVLQKDDRFIKIQVKHTTNRSTGATSYRTKLEKGKSRVSYAEGDFDVLAVYAAPLQTWYNIPFKDIHTREVIVGGTSTEKYKENWDL